MEEKREIEVAADASVNDQETRVGTCVRADDRPSVIDAYLSARPGWRRVREFTDDASGNDLKRPGLSSLLAAAHRGGYRRGRGHRTGPDHAERDHTCFVYRRVEPDWHRNTFRCLGLTGVPGEEITHTEKGRCRASRDGGNPGRDLHAALDR